MRPLRDMATAVRLLTVLPFGTAEGATPLPYFSLVGWLFTALAAGIAASAAALGRLDGTGCVLVAALVVAAWGALSGLLHWDGLADAADGLGVRGDAARRLAVMRDSTVGAFGVTAIVMVALMQVSALAVALEGRAWWALGAPVFGRLSAALALWLRRPASSTGLAARYSGTATLPGAVGLFAPVVPLLALPFPPSPARLAVTLASIAFALVAPGIFTRRLGGVNGDVLGAVVLMTETFVLVTGALIGGL